MERTRSLDAVGLFEELLYWRDAVESSAAECHGYGVVVDRGLRWCPRDVERFAGAVGKVGLIEGDGDLVEGGAVDIGQ